MKRILSIVFTISFQILLSIVFAQDNKLRYEVGFQNDNDVYLMTKSDRYYSNGLSVDFLMSLNRKDESANSLEFNIQHHIYTGVGIIRENKEYLDRPFSASISLQSTFRHFFNPKRQLAIGMRLEQVGPKAGGESVQNFIHTLFNLYEVQGWNNQLPNTFGVDMGASYWEELYTSSNHVFSFGTKLDALVGMNNTFFHVGIPLRLGRIRDMNQSVYSKAHVNSSAENDEFFVFFKPGLKYQVKNSSIDKWNTIADHYPDTAPRHYIFTQDFGVMYSKRKTSISFSVLRYSTEMKVMKYNYHQFGRFQLSRRF